MTPHRLVLAAIVLLTSPVARAGQPFVLESRGGAGVLSGPEAFRVGHIGANDSVGMVTEPSTGKGYDRWFSTGTQLYARWPVAPELAPWLPSDTRLFVSGNLGQDIYTPRNVHLRTADELQGDRPYSGWLAGALGSELVFRSAPLWKGASDAGYTHVGLDLHLGSTGAWSFAGVTQHTAHEGWRTFAGEAMPPMVGWGEVETAPGLTVDTSSFVETSIGAWRLAAPDWMTWSAAAPALHWRGGVRVDAGSMLASAALNTTLVAGWLGDPLASKPAGFPLVAYLYLRGEAKGVAYNGAIERPLADGRVVARSAPLVGEVAAGVVLRVWAVELSWSHVYRTNETASLPRELQTGQLLWQWSAAAVF